MESKVKSGDEGQQGEIQMDENNPAHIPRSGSAENQSASAAPPVSEFERLKAHRDSMASNGVEKWKRRALAFQEGYKDKSFEVTALQIQLMDCRAYGADKVTARNNESLKAKLLAACIERNELRESNAALYEACADLKNNYPDDPGTSDLDDEQPVGMTLGQLRKVWSALRLAAVEATHQDHEQNDTKGEK